MKQAQTTQEALNSALKEAQTLRMALEKVSAYVGRIEHERDALAAQVESLKGIKPELPPFPSQGGSGTPRYGIRWNGEYEPISVPMADDYWTPCHLVEQHLAEIRAEAGRAGYLQGHLDAMGDPDEIDKEHAEYRAKQYANQIRKSGAK